MHVAIDTTPLETGHRLRGTGVYVRKLIESLEKFEGNNSYSYFTQGQKVPDSVDLVHIPYFDPFRITLPFTKSHTTVVTVHDLIPLVFPEHFPAGFKGTLRWQLQRRLLARADRLITDSQNSKQDTARIVPYPAERIDVVYLAPNGLLTGSGAHIPKPKLSGLSGRRYFLYVGDVNWNKNIPGLLRAFAEFQNGNGRDKAALVLVGKAFRNRDLPEAREIMAEISRLKLGECVLMPGFVDEKDLVSLYTHAVAYIQPSFYEGFGLPVLEAMVAGCPAIVAGNSSLKEISGPSVTVRAEEPDTISDAMTKLWEMPGAKRRSLSAEGREWASSFTWQKIARETVRSYEKAIDHHTGI